MNPEGLFIGQELRVKRRKESSNTQVEAVGHAVQGKNLSSNPV